MLVPLGLAVLIAGHAVHAVRPELGRHALQPAHRDETLRRQLDAESDYLLHQLMDEDGEAHALERLPDGMLDGVVQQLEGTMGHASDPTDRALERERMLPFFVGIVALGKLVASKAFLAKVSVGVALKSAATAAMHLSLVALKLAWHAIVSYAHVCVHSFGLFLPAMLQDIAVAFGIDCVSRKTGVAARLEEITFRPIFNRKKRPNQYALRALESNEGKSGLVKAYTFYGLNCYLSRKMKKLRGVFNLALPECMESIDDPEAKKLVRSVSVAANNGDFDAEDDVDFVGETKHMSNLVRALTRDVDSVDNFLLENKLPRGKKVRAIWEPHKVPCSSFYESVFQRRWMEKVLLECVCAESDDVNMDKCHDTIKDNLLSKASRGWSAVRTWLESQKEEIDLDVQINAFLDAQLRSKKKKIPYYAQVRVGQGDSSRMYARQGSLIKTIEKPGGREIEGMPDMPSYAEIVSRKPSSVEKLLHKKKKSSLFKTVPKHGQDV